MATLTEPLRESWKSASLARLTSLALGFAIGETRYNRIFAILLELLKTLDLLTAHLLSHKWHISSYLCQRVWL